MSLSACQSPRAFGSEEQRSAHHVRVVAPDRFDERLEPRLLRRGPFARQRFDLCRDCRPALQPRAPPDRWALAGGRLLGHRFLLPPASVQNPSWWFCPDSEFAPAVSRSIGAETLFGSDATSVWRLVVDGAGGDGSALLRRVRPRARRVQFVREHEAWPACAVGPRPGGGLPPRDSPAPASRRYVASGQRI